MRRFLVFAAVFWLVSAGTGFADDTRRWTGADDTDGSFAHILDKLSALNGYQLTPEGFRLGEERDLAFSHYQRYDQRILNMAVRKMAIRIWTDRRTGKLIQLEARTVAPETVPLGMLDFESIESVADANALRLAKAAVAASEDKAVRGVTSERFWDRGRIVSIVKLKARFGTHIVTVDALSNEIVAREYRPFPNGDFAVREQSVPALVYPVYEEYRGEIQPRRLVRLKHILRRAARPTQDPYEPLRANHYLGAKNDPIKAKDAVSRAEGYWSMAWLKGEVAKLAAAEPLVANDFASGGVLLVGRYATINIHPDAIATFPGVTLPNLPSIAPFYRYVDLPSGDYEIVPGAATRGLPLADRNAALNRDATRNPTHDPATYINNGFDEVQVYYAVNELFDALRPMGFTDPELSERPFTAFLYDPAIEDRDNAFYDDDTINFSTYSPNEGNAARDNTTIWHELGHGVMDRLMGSQLDLNDTGGLSEGMADFVAELVVQAVTGGASFPGKEDQRIINGIGFYLTNEVHDDGEAYGGAMKAILDAGIAKWGRPGLAKVTDLVLETMRLCRDHPSLTADDWFEHMKFADQLGRRGVRGKGELKSLIDQALISRNFASETDRGRFVFRYQGQDLDAGEPGTRGNSIRLTLGSAETSTHTLEIQAVDGAVFHYQWPVEVRVFFNSGPLEGAIHWEGEEQEPLVRVLQGPTDVLRLPLTVRGTCDEINRSDGSCTDFAYVQLWNAGATRPIAKKRFYLNIHTR